MKKQKNVNSARKTSNFVLLFVKLLLSIMSGVLLSSMSVTIGGKNTKVATPAAVIPTAPLRPISLITGELVRPRLKNPTTVVRTVMNNAEKVSLNAL